MRDEIEILRPHRIVDEGGGYSFGYQSLGTVAARAERKRAARDRTFGAEQLRSRKSFLIRSRDDLIFEMRIVERGQTYRITDIQDQDQTGRFALIEGEEIMQ
nr:head-tail adaptor protein [Parvularcula mediterranea]